MKSYVHLIWNVGYYGPHSQLSSRQKGLEVLSASTSCFNSETLAYSLAVVGIRKAWLLVTHVRRDSLFVLGVCKDFYCFFGHYKGCSYVPPLWNTMSNSTTDENSIDGTHTHSSLSNHQTANSTVYKISCRCSEGDNVRCKHCFMSFYGTE